MRSRWLQWPALLTIAWLLFVPACGTEISDLSEIPVAPDVAGSAVGITSDGQVRSPFAENVRVHVTNPRAEPVIVRIRFEIIGWRVHYVQIPLATAAEFLTLYDEADFVRIEYLSLSSTESGAQLPGAAPDEFDAPFAGDTLVVTVPPAPSSGPPEPPRSRPSP